MKKILLLLSLVFSISTSKAQPDSLKVATTWQEYTYISEGIKDYFERGYDLKSNYSLNTAGEVKISFKDAERAVYVVGFYRSDSKRLCAYILIYQKAGGKTEYICIPTIHSDAEMWKRTDEKLSILYDSPQATRTIIYGLMKAFSYESTGPNSRHW